MVHHFVAAHAPPLQRVVMSSTLAPPPAPQCYARLASRRRPPPPTSRSRLAAPSQPRASPVSSSAAPSVARSATAHTHGSRRSALTPAPASTARPSARRALTSPAAVLDVPSQRASPAACRAAAASAADGADVAGRLSAEEREAVGSADVAIITNGPGEVAAWVAPVVASLARLFGPDPRRLRISLNAVLLARRLRYRCLVYSEDAARWPWLVDMSALRSPVLLPAIPPALLAARRARVVGDLFLSAVAQGVQGGQGARGAQGGRGDEGRRGEEDEQGSRGEGEGEEREVVVGLLPGSKDVKLMIGVPFFLSVAHALNTCSHGPRIRFILPLAPTVQPASLARFASRRHNTLIGRHAWLPARLLPPAPPGAGGDARPSPPGGGEGVGWEYLGKLVAGEEEGEGGDGGGVEGEEGREGGEGARGGEGVEVEVWRAFPSYALLSQCSLALTTVGTNTAELAALGVPMVVVLPTLSLELFQGGAGGVLGLLPALLPAGPAAALTRFLNASLLRSLPFLAWPNRWAGREVVPEVVGEVGPGEVAAVAARLLGDAPALDAMGSALRHVASEYGGGKESAAGEGEEEGGGSDGGERGEGAADAIADAMAALTVASSLPARLAPRAVARTSAPASSRADTGACCPPIRASSLRVPRTPQTITRQTRTPRLVVAAAGDRICDSSSDARAPTSPRPSRLPLVLVGLVALPALPILPLVPRRHLSLAPPSTESPLRARNKHAHSPPPPPLVLPCPAPPLCARSLCAGGQAAVDWAAVRTTDHLTVGDCMSAGKLVCAQPSTTVDQAPAIPATTVLIVPPMPMAPAISLCPPVPMHMAWHAGVGSSGPSSSLFPEAGSTWKAFREIQKLLIKTRGRVVADVMTPHPHTVHPSTNLDQAARMLLENQHRRLPVVDDNGKLVGLITRGNVVKAALALKRAAERDQAKRAAQ
ncbi:unnamed protein product [Closterium sp. Yama58-4]|nr:unnamed protein product [Closterium sp. Yama58-4]